MKDPAATGAQDEDFIIVEDSQVGVGTA